MKKKGFWPSGRLLALLGACGLIIAISAWIASKELQRQREWGGLESAKNIGVSVNNHIAGLECVFDLDPAPKTGFGWRATASNFIDASPALSSQEVTAGSAGCFNFANPKSKTTTIYAVEGPKTAFSKENRCRAAELSATTVLFVSGRASKEPWFRAGNVSQAALMDPRPAREVIGEALSGVTFVVFIDGTVWKLKSSVPAELLAACADVDNPTVSAEARNALHEFKID